MTDSSPAAEARSVRTPLGYRRSTAKARRVDPLAPAPSPSASEIDAVQAELTAVIHALTADVGMWFVWLILWLLNGAATVIASIALGTSFGALLLLRGWIETPPGRAEWIIIGVGLHLLISRIEQHAWKPDRWARPPSMRNMQEWMAAFPERLRALRTVRTLQAVAVGSLDSLSSARAMLLLFWDAPGFLARIGCAMMGTGIAMAAEPMMAFHWQRIRKGWELRCFLQLQLASLRSRSSEVSSSS